MIPGFSEEQIIRLKPGEQNKHLSQTGPVYDRLIELGIDRHSVILSLGGGVVGDFTGFIASTLLRGVRFVQLPTTLLSAVDASVGGKVAINVDRGKNMVGSFYQPELVYFNLGTLATLPEREWLCGLAEMVKHAFIDPTGTIFPFLDEHAAALRDPASPLLKRAVLDSVACKAAVVEEDEKEEGLRATLNLGHTTAHAIESVTNYSRFSHGEAVARGLATAIFLSCELSGLSDRDAESMFSLMEKLSLPLDTAGLGPDELLADLRYDKKSIGGIPRFVLLSSVGHPLYGVVVSDGAWRSAWEKQQKRFG